MRLGKTPLFKIFFTFLLFLLVLTQGLPAAGDTIKTIPADSLREIHIRSFSQNSLDSFQNLKEFKYRTAEGSRFSLLHWLTNFISKILGRQIKDIEVPDWLWYLVLSLISIFIILRIFRSNFKPVFYNPLKITQSDKDGIPENIHSINFEESIASAMNSSDYRTALRFHYLKYLKLMFDKGIVQYKKGKSNHDYQKELADINISRIFTRLTLIYEWVWYGKIYPDFETYTAISPEFEKAFKDIYE